MIYTTVKQIDVSDWDNLVRKTYGKEYNFQQQNGCQGRGIFNLTIPSKYSEEEEMNDSIPEVVNGEEMGVKFEVWLARDPNQPLAGEEKITIGIFNCFGNEIFIRVFILWQMIFTIKVLLKQEIIKLI